MTLIDLQTALAARIQKACGAEIDPATLTPYLEAARAIISLQLYSQEVLAFTLSQSETTVAITLEAEEAVLAVYDILIEDNVPSYPLQDHPLPVDGSYELIYDRSVNETPSLLFIEAKYRKMYTRKVDFIQRNNSVEIIKPDGFEDIKGIIIYNALQRFEDLASWLELYLLDAALSRWITDHLITGKIGLIRVPTPDGSFEFDGGRALIALQDKIDDNVKGLSPRTFVGF